MKKFLKICRLSSLSLFLLMVSCTGKKNPEPDPEKGKVLARVGDDFLYMQDLASLVDPSMSPSDSAEVVRKHVNAWVRQTLVVQKAEQELGEEKESLEKQLRENRKSLLSHYYEKKLLAERLDTNVSAAEIEKYYQANSDNFELKKTIIKVNYVKLGKKAPDLNKFRNWFRSEKPEDRALVEKYCSQNAENSYFDDNAWLYLDVLLKEIPIQTYNTELFLQNNRYVEVADTAYLYFLNIKGFKIKNSISPLAFERENIKNIILNRRKLELLQNIRNELYRNAEEKKEFEVFQD